MCVLADTHFLYQIFLKMLECNRQQKYTRSPVLDRLIHHLIKNWGIHILHSRKSCCLWTREEARARINPTEIVVQSDRPEATFQTQDFLILPGMLAGNICHSHLVLHKFSRQSVGVHWQENIEICRHSVCLMDSHNYWCTNQERRWYNL